MADLRFISLAGSGMIGSAGPEWRGGGLAWPARSLFPWRRMRFLDSHAPLHAWVPPLHRYRISCAGGLLPIAIGLLFTISRSRQLAFRKRIILHTSNIPM